MGVPAIAHYTLPGRAYDLWVEGRLMEALRIPDDKRTRVEIIGGEIVVSPGPSADHGYIAQAIQEAITLHRATRPGYVWRCVQVIDFNLPRISDGYIPDLIVLTVDNWELVNATRARNVISKQIAMAVEVTSKSTAADDRLPGKQRRRRTKWNGYAHEEVEYYLLVDRDPNRMCATLFTEPNPALGVYDHRDDWAFGETIMLPEPFGVEIPTDNWLPWEK